MKMFTRDHGYIFTKMYTNIACGIVYVQLDIECRYIAVALRMTCSLLHCAMWVFIYIQLITNKHVST